MILRDGRIVSAMHGSLVTATAAALHVALITSAHAARVERINLAVDGALRTLCGHAPGARALRDEARAVLVFPRIVKTGSASGERGGAGVLREHGISTGYRAARRGRRRGNDEAALDRGSRGRYIRLRLHSERSDGRRRASGLQDHAIPTQGRPEGPVIHALEHRKREPRRRRPSGGRYESARAN